ncbi:hypothetical protein [Neorhodopirellula pilleata]|uniref:Uncharacterized protein n=1 Tax=Neorhodopirellula pilleata TaxID=2714738 RepID=A0A5C6A0A4_9BACT|nr:hypothetical protein [Neorhodopirellula pilleata]TWT92618.1 hypothetical protein Pla100_46380 [Neorhodopirellula pilleata]
MKRFIQRATFGVLLIAVIVSVLTSLPTWFDGHLGGYRLLGHMMASGVIVVALPLYAILRWTDRLTAPAQRLVKLRRAEPIVFWGMVLFGFLTIGTMFVCMMPLASTLTMRALVDLHGWLGAVLALAVAANLASREQ